MGAWQSRREAGVGRASRPGPACAGLSEPGGLQSVLAGRVATSYMWLLSPGKVTSVTKGF